MYDSWAPEYRKDISTQGTHLWKDPQYTHKGNQAKNALVINRNVSARKSDGVISHHSKDSYGKLSLVGTVHWSPAPSYRNFCTGFSEWTQIKSFQEAEEKFCNVRLVSASWINSLCNCMVTLQSTKLAAGTCSHKLQKGERHCP